MTDTLIEKAPAVNCAPESVRTFRADCFPPGRETGRLQSLDALRGFAICLTLFGHFMYRIPEGSVAGPLFRIAHQIGFAGTDIFLVLSGFLIGGMLLTTLRNTGDVAPWRFLGRRFLRLWPSYFLVILFAWGFSHWIGVPDGDGHHAPSVRLTDMWPMLLSIHNYFDLIGYKQGGASAALQTWMLALLFQFYILITAVLSLVARRPRILRFLPWFVGLIAIGCFFLRLRVAPVDEAHYDAYRSYFATHQRIDEPLFGVLLAYWTVFYRPTIDKLMQRLWPLIAALSIALFIPMAIRTGEHTWSLCVWGYTSIALAAGGLIMTLWWLNHRETETKNSGSHGPTSGCHGLYSNRALPVPKPLTNLLNLPLKLLSTIGLWSYSIYLWHQPLCNMYLDTKIRHIIGDRIIPWSSPWNFSATITAYVIACISVGALMYYLLERPTLLLRQKLLPPTMPIPEIA